MKTNVYLEFFGEQIKEADLVSQAKEIWVKDGHKASDLKKIELYVKPEDNRVYYVFNNNESGFFHIENTQNDF